MNLKIVKVECWNCTKEMKIAFLDETIGPREFDEEVIALARSHGVIIEKRFSNMRGEAYNANICPNCNVMLGELFLSDYWYEDALEYLELE